MLSFEVRDERGDRKVARAQSGEGGCDGCSDRFGVMETDDLRWRSRSKYKK